MVFAILEPAGRNNRLIDTDPRSTRVAQVGDAVVARNGEQGLVTAHSAPITNTWLRLAVQASTILAEPERPRSMSWAPAPRRPSSRRSSKEPFRSRIWMRTFSGASRRMRILPLPKAPASEAAGERCCTEAVARPSTIPWRNWSEAYLAL